MLNQKLLYKILGHLLLLEAMMMAVCLGISLLYKEDDVFAFTCSTLATIALGTTFCYKGINAENRMSRRDAYLIVSATWIAFSLVGTLPYIIGGYAGSFTDAFFECMANFTTTGVSVINSKLPHGLLFWRSLTQWIGGLGIVFFTIAILPSFVGGDVKIFAAEATGPTRSRLHPRLSTNSKWIWVVYITLTAACAACLSLAGMDVFDSINYGMATTATGGCTTHEESVAFFHSPAIEYIEIVFMFLAGLNFTMLYSVVMKLNISKLLHDTEAKFYIFITAAFTAAVALMLFMKNGYDIEHATRSALFEVVSIITSTGVYAEDVSLWPHLTWFFLGICMLTGACAGSTSGGMKCIRVVMLLQVVRNEFRRILHPKAVLPVKVNGNVVTTSVQTTLLAFITMLGLIVMLSIAVFSYLGLPLEKATLVTISTVSNCGPSLGVGLSVDWSALPFVGKWLCTALMLVGRLEIFSFLVIFTRSYWDDH